VVRIRDWRDASDLIDAPQLLAIAVKRDCDPLRFAGFFELHKLCRCLWHRRCCMLGIMKLSTLLCLLSLPLVACAVEEGPADPATEDADLGAKQNPFVECTFKNGTQQTQVSFAKNKPRSWKGKVLGAEFEVGMSSNHLQTVTVYAGGLRQIAQTAALYPTSTGAEIAQASRGDASVSCRNANTETFPKDASVWETDGAYVKAPAPRSAPSLEGYVVCSGSADLATSDKTDVYFKKSNIGVYAHQFAISKASFRITATETGVRDVRISAARAACTVPGEVPYQMSGAVASCGGGRYVSAEAGWGTYAGSVHCSQLNEAELALQKADTDRTLVEIFPTP
jgi:hypothetical protein